MNPDKYTRQVSLACPTCGSSHFSYEQGVDEAIEMMKCASCERQFTKDELLRENGENIDEHLHEIAKEATEDLAKEFRDMLKKSFGNSKYIKIK